MTPKDEEARGNAPKPVALLVEDDELFRESLSTLIVREGFKTLEADSLARAKDVLDSEPVDVCLVDLSLPDGPGMSLLLDETIRLKSDFIVVTGNATVDTAVEALREGALDYLTKPVDRARLKSVLQNVFRTRELRSEVQDLRGELRSLGRFGKLVGRSQVMQDVYDLITKVAPTKANALVVGESGTGKELVAETIHLLSERRSKSFLPVNCGAMARNVIESELFGHEKGSFTGADRTRRGYFETADGGTLFLDEIAEMPLELQVQLLRVLETSQVMRVGASKPVTVDVRLVAATNRDPEKSVKDGTLREDLFYRLNVFPIRLPPLRERKEDIPLLAEHFLKEVSGRDGMERRWSPDALRKLSSLPFPGNVRELKNVTERAAILADETIGPELLPDAGADAVPPAGDSADITVQVGSTLADVERRLILSTLRKTDGDKKRAAEILGISVKTIYNRLKVYEAAGEVAET